jgi:hypothetical protein
MAACVTGGTLGTGGSGCGGGGGGGYFGGGGGGFVNGDCCDLDGILMDGPGGGGSGFVTPSATGVRTGTGLQFGNGMVRISYDTTRPHPGLDWSAPVPIDPGGTLTGISCPSTTFCVAVDAAGNAAVDDAGVWSTFTAVAGPGNDFTSVSCASRSLCVAVGSTQSPDYDDDLAVIYNDGSWSSNTSVSVVPGETLTSVSCAPNTDFCMAVGWGFGGPGDAMVSETYDGDGWTAYDDGSGYGSSGDQLTTVSCASPTFCVTGGIVQERTQIGNLLGIDFHGRSGGGQINEQQVDGLIGTIDASSCAGDSCFAAGDGSYVFAVKKASWSGPLDPDGSSTITALSCTSASSCVAVDGSGDAVTARSGTWSAPLSVDPGERLTGVSCPTLTFCAAVDSAGDVVVGS